jgi:hypothetical protein
MTTWVMRVRDRALVELCYKEGLTQQEAFEKLQQLYDDGPSRKTIYNYYETILDGSFCDVDPLPCPRSDDLDLMKNVSKAILHDPYLSLRRLADVVNSNKDSVRAILINQLGLRKLHCKWVPHTLNKLQKLARVTGAVEMLSSLRPLEKTGFPNLFTGDESWFLYSYPFTSYWGKKDAPRPEIPKTTIGTPKIMVVVFWGVDGVPVLKFLERGEGMNASRFQELVLKDLFALQETLPADQRLLLHWDNAPAHTATTTKALLKTTRAVVIPQPPYSPDIAPSDFFLFGYLKGQIRGRKCETGKDILKVIGEIMGKITRAKRIEVFRDWIWRLESVIASGGEYY